MNTERLLAWFEHSNIPLGSGARLEVISGGRSNISYRVSDDSGTIYVLRRPPAGADATHDIGREYRICTALQGTDVPVATTRGLCTDADVLGAPFYVMDHVPGQVLGTDVAGAALPTDLRRAASVSVVDTLALVHSVDVDACGLGRLGRRDGYAERQLARWQKQADAAGGESTGVLDSLHDRLAATRPEQRRTGLVHGDYKFGNVIVDDRPGVAAVLDWELSTLGDCYADIGFLIATWVEPGERILLDAPTAHPGYLTRDEVATRYQQVVGESVPQLAWYEAFAFWRLACIVIGVLKRYRDGSMAADGFDAQGHESLATDLAERGRDALTRLR